MNVLNRVRNGWTVLKFLQVGLGSLILYTGIENREIPGIVAGSIFTLAALLGNGMCCMAGTCKTGVRRKQTDSETANTTYEELGAE